jgi:PTS system mannose-specific IIA component
LIGIVIVAHGGLAREYLSAVEHVVGKQAGMRAIAIEDEHDREAKQAEIMAAATSVDTGQGVVVVTRELPVPEAVAAALDAGRKYINSLDLGSGA